jgi:hypothetical protein
MFRTITSSMSGTHGLRPSNSGGALEWTKITDSTEELTNCTAIKGLSLLSNHLANVRTS